MLQAARVSLDNELFADDISQNEGVHYVMRHASAVTMGHRIGCDGMLYDKHIR